MKRRRLTRPMTRLSSSMTAAATWASFWVNHSNTSPHVALTANVGIGTASMPVLHSAESNSEDRAGELTKRVIPGVACEGIFWGGVGAVVVPLIVLPRSVYLL